MFDDRYTIQVSDYKVEIYGNLTIEEGFDFLSFFERKGYKSICDGHENSCLSMSKDIIENKLKESKLEEKQQDERFYENLYYDCKAKNDNLNDRIESLESIIKSYMEGEKARIREKMMEEMRKGNKIDVPAGFFSEMCLGSDSDNVDPKKPFLDRE